MTRKIRVGMQFHPQQTTIESFLVGVRRAEEIGLDTLWNWDHFFPALWRPRWATFRGMDAAHGDGDGDEARRDRLSGHV